MSFRAPTRCIPVGEDLWTFRGDLEASYEFAEMTGKGLEDAFQELKPFLRLREIPGEVEALKDALQKPDCEDKDAKLVQLAMLRAEFQEHDQRRFDPRVWMQLAFAFSVDHRNRSGFNSQNHVPADADRHPMDRTNWRAFLRLWDPTKMRQETRDIIFDLYSDYITPPGITEIETGAPAMSVGGSGAT